MGPTPSDLSLAEILAQRIVGTAGEAVQRVVMIGSRARGTARPNSDLDLVVLVEIAADAPPWGPADTIAARRRLEPAITASPIATEVWVRTTDRYAEARGTIGGVEHAVDSEGIDVFARAPTGAPIVRRTPDQVRREHVSAWVEHALTALEGTIRLEQQPGVPPWAPGHPRTPDEAARICVERAVNALLVLHQRPIGKDAGLDGKIALLGGKEPAAAAWLRKTLGPAPRPSHLAHTVLSGVMRRLARDADLRRYVHPSFPRLAKMTTLVGLSGAVPNRGVDVRTRGS
jgi:predicted nucleotidyltransferase